MVNPAEWTKFVHVGSIGEKRAPFNFSFPYSSRLPGKLNIASRKLSDPGGDGGMYLENPQTLGLLGRVTHMVGVTCPAEILWQERLP